MKIAYDGKRATQNLTGLGNYGRYIIRLLATFRPENKYIVYAVKPPRASLKLTDVHYKYAPPNSFRVYWRSYGIVKDLIKEKINLFHGLSNEIPFGLSRAGIRSVVTIHDLIFMRFPQYYPVIDRFIYTLKFKHAVLNADKVIAISEQTKNDIIAFFGVSESRIEVIYQNCDPIFYELLSPEVRCSTVKKYNLPTKYILNVGTIEERKNLLLIVKALTELDDLHLVVVGKKTKYTEKVESFISQNKLTDRVHFLQNVAYVDLPAIYQEAELFVYPSRFEGFGIPIIEALHSGIPVIAAKGSCLEEAGGPSSIYVNPDDHHELAAQLMDILGDDNKKAGMVAAGKEYVAKFQNEKISLQIQELYENILDNA